MVREKLLTISNVHVLQCLCELVATLHAVGKLERAYSYALVAKESFALVKVKVLKFRVNFEKGSIRVLLYSSGVYWKYCTDGSFMPVEKVPVILGPNHFQCHMRTQYTHSRVSHQVNIHLHSI